MLDPDLLPPGAAEGVALGVATTAALLGAPPGAGGPAQPQAAHASAAQASWRTMNDHYTARRLVAVGGRANVRAAFF